MTRKKIAVIGTRGIPATYGGIEKHCEDLYSTLSKMGYEITVYARDYYLQKKQFQYNSIKIKSLYVPNIKGFEAFLHSFISTIHACFSDADILHFHAQGPSIFCWIPKIFTPYKKVVFTCHGIDWQRDKWKTIGKFVIKLGEMASAVFPHRKICVSQTLSDYYMDKYSTKSEKIVNGVQIKEKIPLNKGKRFNIKAKDYIIFVGRLVPEKTPDILIKAFKNSSCNKKLLIVGGSAGTDKYCAKLKQMAECDDRIIFTDYVYGEELQELYSNAYAYISASKLEGLPLTVLEAMSYSLPIILSDIPPHKEILKLHPGMGFEFRTGDIENCTKIIEKINSISPEEVEDMGNHSLNTVREYFGWEKTALHTDEVYKSCFNQN
jgi:glycosyltransferase involved in cell wall biosynthesis